MSLVDDIKEVQAFYGLDRDGVAGPDFIGAVLADIRHRGGSQVPLPESTLDERTRKNIAKLDPKARDRFEHFTKLAKATAATFGCEYVMISTNRTWAEQDALYAQPTDGKDNDGDGRVDEPDEKVTNARGGESNHNFGIAADYGVFRGKSYLDNSNPELASRVHAACAVHARKLGFECGADWKGKKCDPPHYEISTSLTLGQKRKLYQEKGSVL